MFVTMNAYIKNTSNKWHNDALKALEKEEQAKSQISRWKEILKIRAEISKMETKSTL
jgi:hypothetical protein